MLLIAKIRKGVSNWNKGGHIQGKGFKEKKDLFRPKGTKTVLSL